MQITPKARLVSLIVALVFMAGTLIGSGTYLIINHINKANATTSTDYIIEDNLYNTNGTLNTTAVAEFLDAIGYTDNPNDTGTYQANQILSRNSSSSYSGDKTIVFKMGYYTPKGGNSSTMDTDTEIEWQATYLWSGKDNKPYLTIWMARSYTSEYFNNGTSSNSGWKTSSTSYSTVGNYSNSLAREVTKNIYSALASSLTDFSKLIVSPSAAGATWQATQENAWYSSSYWSITNGMQTNTDTGGTSMSNVNKWGWDWDGTVYEDMFWLPSHVEISDIPGQSSHTDENGLWGIKSANDRKDASNTALDGKSTSQYCWLRSGRSNSSNSAMLVNSSGSANNSIVRNSYGVRPAAHLSLSALEDALPPQYTISVTSNNQTYGTVSTSGGTYIEGSTLSVTATPNPHYQFVRWERNGTQVSTSASYTFTVFGNYTYTAVFEPVMYTVTTDVYPAGAGTVSGGGSYQYNTQATLTASANNGYKFVGWDTNRNNQYDSGEPTVNPYRFTVTGNALVTAIFEKLPTITITTNSENYGKILYNNSLITSTQVIQDSGTQISNLYAISSASYAFLYWLDTATGQRYTANPLTYTVSADSTLTAIFGSSMADGVAVCVESLEGATAAIGEARITGYSNIDGVDYVHFSAVAYTGYKFLGWYIMGEETPISTELSTDLSLSQVQNKIIIARFTSIENLDDMNTETDNGYNDDFA